jgi:hypothetical protein
MALALGSYFVGYASSEIRLATPVFGEDIAGREATMPERLPGRDILVSGAGGVATQQSPATVAIDLGREPVSARTNLELLLSPTAAVPDQAYLIIVSARVGNDENRLGAVSFYPPRPGVVQAFYFGSAPILALLKEHGSSRMDLSIALVPASREESLTGSAVRIVGARLVGG